MFCFQDVSHEAAVAALTEQVTQLNSSLGALREQHSALMHQVGSLWSCLWKINVNVRDSWHLNLKQNVLHLTTAVGSEYD